MKSTDFLTMPTDPIRAALERLLQVIKPEYNETDEIIAVAQAIAAARVALATEPERGPSDEQDQCWQWYAYDPERGIEMYPDREQARSAAQSIMDTYQEAAHSDGWHEDMESVSWGMLVPFERAQIVARRSVKDSKWDEWVQYELRTARESLPGALPVAIQTMTTTDPKQIMTRPIRADLAAEPLDPAGGGEALLAAPAAEGDGQRSAVLEAVGKALGNAYDCLRVWEAWSVGTMGPDDFALVAEDDARLAEIADAAIQAMRPVVEKETKQLRLLFDKTRHRMADSLGVDRGCGWTSLAIEARNLRSAATPAADWAEPSDEQLIDAWNENSEYYALHTEACNFARDVLTRWGRLAATAAPAAPPKGEVGKLVAWLNDGELVAWLNNHAAHLRTMEGIGALPETELQERLDRAATLLQQQAAELALLRAPQGGEVV